MKKAIEIYKKVNYGNVQLYVVDQSIAQAIFKMSGQKTLTSNVRTGLETLGFEFIEVLPKY